MFFAFAMQCMSTMAVVRRETNGWKWPAVQFAYMTIVAYVSAFAAYHIAGLLHQADQFRSPIRGSTSPAFPSSHLIEEFAVRRLLRSDVDRSCAVAACHSDETRRRFDHARCPNRQQHSRALQLVEDQIHLETELRRTSRCAGESARRILRIAESLRAFGRDS